MATKMYTRSRRSVICFHQRPHDACIYHWHMGQQILPAVLGRTHNAPIVLQAARRFGKTCVSLATAEPRTCCQRRPWPPSQLH